MVNILDVPTEIMRSIVSALAKTDLRSSFAARRTCRTFDILLNDILDKSLPDHGPEIHTFLKTHFATLLDSSAAQPSQYRTDTDTMAPLRALPWAANRETRQKYLQSDASWLRIPLVSESGVMVRRLQVVRCAVDEWPWNEGRYDAISGWDVYFASPEDNEDVEIELQPPGGVTIGGLYDVVIREGWDVEQYPFLARWELLFGVRVVDLEAFLKLRLRCDEDNTIAPVEVKELFVQDADYAILFAVKDRITPVEGAGGKEEDVWRPESIQEQETTTGRFNEDYPWQRGWQFRDEPEI